MSKLIRLNCTVGEFYPAEDVERLVNRHADQRRNARRRRAQERRLHCLGVISGVTLLCIFAAAFMMWLT